MHTLCFIFRVQLGGIEEEQLTQQLMAAASSLTLPLLGCTRKRKRIPYTLVEASKGNRLVAREARKAGAGIESEGGYRLSLEGALYLLCLQQVSYRWLQRFGSYHWNVLDALCCFRMSDGPWTDTGGVQGINP